MSAKETEKNPLDGSAMPGEAFNMCDECHEDICVGEKYFMMTQGFARMIVEDGVLTEATINEERRQVQALCMTCYKDQYITPFPEKMNQEETPAEPSLQAPEPLPKPDEPIGECNDCGKDLYLGDPYFTITKNFAAMKIVDGELREILEKEDWDDVQVLCLPCYKIKYLPKGEKTDIPSQSQNNRNIPTEE